MNTILSYSSVFLSTILGIIGWLSKNSRKATMWKIVALIVITGTGLVSILSVYIESGEKALAQNGRQQAEADLNAIKSEITQKPKLSVSLNGQKVKNGQAYIITASNGLFSLEFCVFNDGRRTATQVEVALLPFIPSTRLSHTPLPWEVHECVMACDHRIYASKFPYNWLHLDFPSALSPSSSVFAPVVLIDQVNNEETLSCPIKISCAEADPYYLLLTCVLKK